MVFTFRRVDGSNRRDKDYQIEEWRQQREYLEKLTVVNV